MVTICKTALENLLVIVGLKNLIAHIASEVLIEIHTVRAGFLLNVEGSSLRPSPRHIPLG